MPQINQHMTTESALEARAIKSYQEIANFLSLMTEPGNEDLVETHFKKEREGYYIVNLERSVPGNPDHKGLFLSFEEILFGGSGELINRGDGTYNIVLRSSLNKKHKEKRGAFTNRDLVLSINRWFSLKKTYYRDNFIKFLRAKYHLDRASIPTFTKGKAETDPEVLRAFYNDPEQMEATLAQAKTDILHKVHTIQNQDRLEIELGLSSANTFIEKTFSKYFHPDYKKYLTFKNRYKLFSDIYDIYLSVKEEIEMSKTKKLTTEELQKMIRKEIVSILESDKGAPVWKGIGDVESPDSSVQPPDDVDGGDTAPESLKDLMGLGGEEVLVAPDKKVPSAGKDEKKHQLEPSAKQPMSEGARKANPFLMFDLQDDDSFRF